MLRTCGCESDGEVAGTPGGFSVDGATTGYTIGTPGGATYVPDGTPLLGIGIDAGPAVRALTDAGLFLSNWGGAEGAIGALLLGLAEMAGMIVDLERNDGSFRVTRDAFRTKMRTQCDQAQRRLDELDAAKEASVGFGIGLDSIPGLPSFITEANVRAASLAQRAWFCSMKSGGKPTLAQSLATVTTLRTLTGGLYPMTTSKMTTTHNELVAYIDILNNGFAAPSSSPGAPMATTPVQDFMNRVTLLSEKGLINPQLSVVRAHNAQATAVVAAFNAASGSRITVCGPEPLGPSNDPVVAAARARFASCRAQAAAAFAAHQGNPSSGSPSSSSPRFLPIVAGAVAGGLMGGPLGAVAGAVIAGAVSR